MRLLIAALALAVSLLLAGCEETFAPLADSVATIEALETEVAELRTVVATADEPIVLAARESFECFREAGDERPIEVEYVLAGELRRLCAAIEGDCVRDASVGEALPEACRALLPQ